MKHIGSVIFSTTTIDDKKPKSFQRTIYQFLYLVILRVVMGKISQWAGGRGQIFFLLRSSDFLFSVRRTHNTQLYWVAFNTHQFIAPTRTMSNNPRRYSWSGDFPPNGFCWSDPSYIRRQMREAPKPRIILEIKLSSSSSSSLFFSSSGTTNIASAARSLALSSKTSSPHTGA